MAVRSSRPRAVRDDCHARSHPGRDCQDEPSGLPKMRILLGHISTAHGIRGEVVIKSHTDDPLDIGAYGALFNEDGSKTYTIEPLRVAKKGVVARIEGVTDRNSAEALRGTKLYVERDKLPEPDDDEVYHADIIGMVAQRSDRSDVGEVIALQNFGASDLLEIRLAGKKRT